MSKLTTDRQGNIKINNICTGWTIEKTSKGWITRNFDDDKSETFKTKKQALGATGLDW